MLPDVRWASQALRPGTLVDRRVAAGVERVRVVTGGEVEVAVVVELHRPTRVAALVALRRDVEDRRRRVELQRVARHRVARDAVDRLRAGRRVVEVDPVVRGEVGVQRDAEQAELLAGVDRDRARGQHAAVRLDDAHGAVAVDVEHPAVIGDGELHRVGGVLVEGHLLEAGRQGRLAVRVHDTGSGLDAAEDVAQEPVGEGRLGVTHAGVPAAAAVVVLAPGDRVLGAHRAVARGVGGLVQRGQHVELVRGLAAGLVRKLYHSSVRCQRRSDAGGGRVRRVLDLDGRGRGARRVVVEVGADEVAVPGPVVLGVGGRVDAGVAAAGLDVALERGLLGGLSTSPVVDRKMTTSYCSRLASLNALRPRWRSR